VIIALGGYVPFLDSPFIEEKELKFTLNSIVIDHIEKPVGASSDEWLVYVMATFVIDNVSEYDIEIGKIDYTLFAKENWSAKRLDTGEVLGTTLESQSMKKYYTSAMFLARNEIKNNLEEGKMRFIFEGSVEYVVSSQDEIKEDSIKFREEY
jgi:hypothetical protein